MPNILTSDLDKVAIRIPNHDVPRGLARRLGNPITGTSANLSGQAPSATADEVRKQIGDDVDYIIDGGRLDAGMPSTVLDVSNGYPRLIRQGIVTMAAIETVCGVRVAEPEK